MASMRMIGAILAGALLTYMVGQSGRAPLSTATPTYYRDVLPILQKHCEVCHRAGGIAPFSLASYEMVGRYADAIRLATQNRSMPPWFAEAGIGQFANDPSLSSEEIATLAAWVETKKPVGASHDAPAPAKWTEEWSIPRPDLVVQMTQAVELPA